jgi:ankyrin repeat protein
MDADNKTALQIAVENGRYSSAAALLEQWQEDRGEFLRTGPHNNRQEPISHEKKEEATEADRAALRFALDKDQKAAILKLLERPGFMGRNAKTKDGTSALHLAAYWNWQDLCDIILEKKPAYAEIHSKARYRDDSEWTALQIAARWGHRDICKAILKHTNFKEFSIQDQKGKTALQIAVEYGYSSTAEILQQWQMDRGENLRGAFPS